MSDKKTYGKTRAGSPIAPAAPIAYFSAEFGFHESVPNYSGGLGILSGDHCKSASDLDLPFVAFTLLFVGLVRARYRMATLRDYLTDRENDR